MIFLGVGEKQTNKKSDNGLGRDGVGISGGVLGLGRAQKGKQMMESRASGPG